MRPEEGTDAPALEATPPNRETRFLWSPVIHRALNETCYYFVFTCTHSRGRKLQDQLREIHESLQMRGVTAYVVQGTYDLILRVWLTPLRRQAYLDRLESESRKLCLASLSEFGADHVDYAWLDHEQTEMQRSLAKRQAELVKSLHAELDTRIDSQSLRPLPQAIPELTASGYLIPVTDPTSRRLFMFISREFGIEQIPGTRLHDDILGAAQRARLVSVSVYRGSGFCDFILKGFFPDDMDKLDGITILQDDLAEMGLVGWTLSPMGVAYFNGSESIDAYAEDSTRILADLMENAREEYFDGDILRASLQDEQNAKFVLDFLQRLESERLSVTDYDTVSRLRRRIQSIIAGLLTGNRKRVNRELSFLVSIPSDLRDALGLLRDGEIPIDLGGGAIPDLAAMGEELVALSERNRVDVDAPLPTDAILPYLKSATTVRQSFFSGEVFAGAYRTRLDNSVEDVLIEVADAALLQMYLEALRDSLIDRDQ